MGLPVAVHDGQPAREPAVLDVAVEVGAQAPEARGVDAAHCASPSRAKRCARRDSARDRQQPRALVGDGGQRAREQLGVGRLAGRAGPTAGEVLDDRVRPRAMWSCRTAGAPSGGISTSCQSQGRSARLRGTRAARRQRLARIAVAREDGHELVEGARRLAVHERLEQAVEVVEVPVDDRPRDARLARDRLDRHAVEATLGDDRLGRVEQLLAAFPGLHAHRRMLHLCRLGSMGTSTSTSRSSAAASPGSAWPSASSRRGSRTSPCSSVGTTWAAPGTSTPTRAAPATCPRTSTPSPSPQPRLERHLLAPARDPRLPAARRRRVRHPPACAAQPRRQRHRMGGRRLDRRDLRRAAARARRRRRHGPAGRAQDAAARGPRGLRGRDVPLRALEPRLRPQGQARRRRRHRRLGDPVRARDPEGRRAAARDPAHRAVGHAAPEPADPALGGAAVRSASRGCRSSCAAPPTAAASCSCSASSSTRG